MNNVMRAFTIGVQYFLKTYGFLCLGSRELNLTNLLTYFVSNYYTIYRVYVQKTKFQLIIFYKVIFQSFQILSCIILSLQKCLICKKK